MCPQMLVYLPTNYAVENVLSFHLIKMACLNMPGALVCLLFPDFFKYMSKVERKKACAIKGVLSKNKYEHDK